MAKPTSITIRVLNFHEYKGRKDVEHNSWFRCSNRLLEDPDFYDFTHEELLVWIYILSLSSQKNSDVVSINFAHAERVCRLKTAFVLSAIEKLKGKQVDPVDVTPTSRGRNADVTETCATDKTDKTDKTDITEQDITNTVSPDVPSGLTPSELFLIWKDNRETLPDCERLSDERVKKARAQIKKYPDRGHWLLAIKKFTNSEFCINDWRPGFDDFLAESKRLRAIEGRYDRRDRTPLRAVMPSKSQVTIDRLRSQAERVLKGEL